MLRPRITPCLLVRDSGLTKTVQFEPGKYVGDPLNAVRIFNEKEVDELVVLDIDATREGREPDYNLIKNLANECRMPLCYGGGIRSVEQIRQLVGLGVEKVALGTAAADTPQLITDGARSVGSQSIVVVVDYRKAGWRKNEYVYVTNGGRKTDYQPIEYARRCQDLGAGELIVQSIDRDGMMEGYDFELASEIRASVSIPLTILGGARNLDDMSRLFSELGTVGAAAGSLFVFKGRLRSVLINYPSREEKNALFASTNTPEPESRLV